MVLFWFDDAPSLQEQLTTKSARQLEALQRSREKLAGAGSGMAGCCRDKTRLAIGTWLIPHSRVLE